MKQLFFAYPSKPAQLREANYTALETIGGSGLVESISWESLRVSGTFVIDTILEQIRASDLCVCDVTEPNENVMFELGYAIGANKPVWLLRDPSWKEADAAFQAIRVLTTVGHTPYASSDDIIATFFREMPHDNASPIFESSILPTLQQGQSPSVLHLMSPQQDDAARAVSRAVDKARERGRAVISADPEESTSAPLAWYAQQIHASDAIVVHFGSPGRSGSEITNPRYALVAGLAHGMGTPVLMLASSDYLAPVDYRDMLHICSGSAECGAFVTEWTLTRLPASPRGEERAAQIRLATELRSLRLGEHIAENEVATLSHYFVDTPGYRHLLGDATAIFVGRKGIGKTANFFEAAAHFAQDARVLAVVIKPHSYELEGIVRLLKAYEATDAREFLAESIWRLLLYTSIASAAATEIRSRPFDSFRDGSPEFELLTFTEKAPELFVDDFALRIDYVLSSMGVPRPGSSVSGDRKQIGEALHENLLPYLRQLLGKILSERDRVAVLVDNLDKAWGREQQEVEFLTHFLIGLVSSARYISQEFAKHDAWRDPLNVTLGVFVRDDIFREMQRLAREPDKLPVTHLRWDDPEMLLRVLEARYEAARDTSPAKNEMWERFFCSTVKGVDTKEYVVGRVLPRPRDIVFLCNAAIDTAIGRGHTQVTEEDVLKAEEAYSQFAFEAIQVEDGFGDFALGDVFYEFAGAPQYLEASDLDRVLVDAGIDKKDHASVVERLKQLSFLGVETRDQEFEYLESSIDARRVEVLARKTAAATDRDRRYEIHPAFRSYLEVVELSDYVI